MLPILCQIVSRALSALSLAVIIANKAIGLGFHIPVTGYMGQPRALSSTRFNYYPWKLSLHLCDPSNKLKAATTIETQSIELDIAFLLRCDDYQVCSERSSRCTENVWEKFEKSQRYELHRSNSQIMTSDKFWQDTRANFRAFAQ